MRQNRCRGAGRVVTQGRSCPIVGHGVRASHLVPKRELTTGRWRNKCLRNARVAVRRARATNKRCVGAAMSASDDGRRSRRTPTR